MTVSKNHANYVVTDPGIQDAMQGLPPILRLAEVAALTRTSVRTLQRHIASGRLRTLKAVEEGPSRVLVARAEVGRFLESMVRT
jgi:excisionase family DNA binding protein